MGSQTIEVTQLLLNWSEGDEQALDALMPVVFDELRRIASSYFDRERVDHTLQPTALVNEVYLRLIDRRKVHWKNRAHFFGFAAQMMRRILVDHARRHRAAKRGDGIPALSFEEALGVPDQDQPDLVALDEALTELAKIDARQSRIVELKYFAGLTIEEIAEVVKTSPTTVKREWRLARLWLFREIDQN